MNLYVESSAVLAWLLGEAEGPAVRAALAAAALRITSALTVVEVERCIRRGEATGRFGEAHAAGRRAALAELADDWQVLALADEQLERACRPFPVEPVRTLDALHLAAALQWQQALRVVSVLSLDARVRDNARRLGFAVLPA